MDITELLDRAAGGDEASAHRVLPIIYDNLRAIARNQLKMCSGAASLETRELVHEAYLAIFGDADISWRDRKHFFAYAAKAMRNILIDRARRHLSQKRGAGAELVDIDDVCGMGVDAECIDLVALDQALATIAGQHPRLVHVVELRFFAGLSVEEVAAALDITTRSVERDWKKARAYISQAMSAANP